LEEEYLGNEIKIASSITPRYSDGKGMGKIRVSYERVKNGEKDTITVSPIDEQEIEYLRI
jgi:hypothetical protein